MVTALASLATPPRYQEDLQIFRPRVAYQSLGDRRSIQRRSSSEKGAKHENPHLGATCRRNSGGCRRRCRPRGGERTGHGGVRPKAHAAPALHCQPGSCLPLPFLALSFPPRPACSSVDSRSRTVHLRTVPATSVRSVSTTSTAQSSAASTTPAITTPTCPTIASSPLALGRGQRVGNNAEFVWNRDPRTSVKVCTGPNYTGTCGLVLPNQSGNFTSTYKNNVESLIWADSTN